MDFNTLIPIAYRKNCKMAEDSRICLRKNLLQRDTRKKLQRTFATCDDVDALAASPVLSKHELNPKPTHSSSSSSSSNNNNNNNNNKNAASQKLQKPQMPSARACARSNTKENQTTQQRADLRRRWNSVQQSHAGKQHQHQQLRQHHQAHHRAPTPDRTQSQGMPNKRQAFHTGLASAAKAHAATIRLKGSCHTLVRNQSWTQPWQLQRVA